MATSRPTGRDPRADDRTRAVIASLLGSAGKGSPSYFVDLADRIESLLDATRTGGEIAGYRLIHLLGHGGSGVVYLGRHVERPEEPEVAVKLLVPGLAYEVDRERFRMEADALQGLRHPGIARMVAGGVAEDGTPYLVRERVEGLPIDRFCDRHRLTVAERLRLVLQLCDAVAYAHRKGIVHGDLKPANILVDPGGNVHLIDFSSAAILAFGKQMGRREPIGFAASFTPDHASPEQLCGKPLARTADVYTVGVLLHELLTGQLPCRRQEGDAGHVAPLAAPAVPMARCLTRQRRNALKGAQEVAHLRRTTVPKLRRRLRGGLEDVVQRALDPDPDRRYQQIEELAEDIARQVEGGSRGAADIVRRHPVAAAFVGLFGLFVVFDVLLPVPGRG